MNDNILIENVEFTEELYKKSIESDIFINNDIHGIGEDVNGNS